MKATDQFNISKSQVRKMKQSKELLRQLKHSPSIFGKKRKRHPEQNGVGGAFFTYPDYREKKSSPRISPLCGSN